MKSLLDALQEGRLIELPEIDKGKILNLLATLIEAIPDFRSGFDFAGAVAGRENAANTGIGLGWACPHGRVTGEGELFCAIGWSPTGIDYGAPDGKPVRIVVMHYIPDSQKNVYLREISGLAKAIKSNPALGELSGAEGPRRGEAPSHRSAHRRGGQRPAGREGAHDPARGQAGGLRAGGDACPLDALSALNLIPLSVVVVPGSKPARSWPRTRR